MVRCLYMHTTYLALSLAIITTATLLLSADGSRQHSNLLSLDSRNCTKVHLQQLDRTLGDTSVALVYRDLQLLDLGKEGVQASIPKACAEEVPPRWRNGPVHFPFEADKMRFGTTIVNKTDQRVDGCKKVAGTWLLLGDKGHSNGNILEELVQSWYPSYLALKRASNVSEASLGITHVGGTRKGWVAFPEVYASFGSYRAWELLLAGGNIFTSSKVLGCLEFETVVTVVSSYDWLACPVYTHFNPSLATFASHIWHHFATGNTDTPHADCSRCERLMIYAKRSQAFRRIVNEDELVSALATAFPQYRVVARDFQLESVSEHAAVLRRTHVLIFPHGEEGPMSLFLPAGAAAVELFPFGFADPLYRNIITMSGKVYLAWQNQDLAKASGPVNSRNSNTFVDIPAVLDIVRAAATVASFNVADSFMPLEKPFDLSREHFDCKTFDVSKPLDKCPQGVAGTAVQL